MKGEAAPRISRSRPASATFQWLRTAAIGLSAAFVLMAAEAVRLVFAGPKAVDFLSYWAAGRLVITDRIETVYDIAAHRLVEIAIAPVEGWLPFPYPPPFLLLVSPFGALPYPAAFAVWGAITYTLFAAASALWGKRLLPFALSQPGVLANFLNGQNGFLTSSLLMTGAHLLTRNPAGGGAVLGLLVIKPQLAVAVPFALVAGREWKAVAGAATSSACALIVAGLVLGIDAYKGFFRILPIYANSLGASNWPWNEMASPFAAMRFLGFSHGPALATHIVIAAVAVTVTCWAWRVRSENRIATLAAASMLIPPYVFTYDCLFLVLPVLALARDERSPFAVSAVWILCALPILTYFDWYPGPNTIPLAALLCLWMLNAPRPRGSSSN